MISSRTLLPLLFALSGVAACGDDAGPSPDPDARLGDMSPADAGPGDASDDAGPEGVPGAGGFVVNQLLITPEGFSAFAAFAESLGAADAVDPSASVELPFSTLLSPGPTGRSFLASSGTSPEVFRYDVALDGTVTEAGPVSFAGRGVAITQIPPKVVAVSSTKAYYLDSEGLRGFVFDPTDLVITGEFSLEAIGPVSAANPEVVLSVQTFLRERDLLIMVILRDIDEGSAEQLARVLRIDVETDAVSVIEDARCGYLGEAVLAANGDLYLASGPFNGGSVGARPDAAGPSGILRIRAGESVFDPGFFVTHESLTGTPVSGGLVKGPGDTAFVVAYDESVAPLGATQDEINGTPAWRTYAITIGGDTIAPGTVEPGIPLRSGATSPLVVGEGSYDAVAAADFTSSTIYRYDLPGGPEAGLSLPGFALGLVGLTEH